MFWVFCGHIQYQLNPNSFTIRSGKLVSATRHQHMKICLKTVKHYWMIWPSFILVSCFLYNTTGLWEPPVILEPVSYMLPDFYHPRRWNRCIPKFCVIWSHALMCTGEMIHSGTCRPGSAVLLRVSQLGWNTMSKLFPWHFVKARIELPASFPEPLTFNSVKHKHGGHIFHFLNGLYIWCKKPHLFWCPVA